MKTKKIIILVLSLFSFVFFTKQAHAGKIIAVLTNPFVDPVTSLIVADRFSCSINLIWGCDKNGNPLPPPKGCQTSTSPNFNGINGGSAKNVAVPHNCVLTHSFESDGGWGTSDYTCNDGTWKITKVQSSDGNGCNDIWNDNCGNASANAIYCGPPAGCQTGDAPNAGGQYGSKVNDVFVESGTDLTHNWATGSNFETDMYTCSNGTWGQTYRDGGPNNVTACMDEWIYGSTTQDVPCPSAGVCGSANGQSFASAPTANLCDKGTVANFSGTGPWTWTCQGSGGQPSANCSAQKTCAPDYAYSCIKITGASCNDFSNCGKAITTEQANCVVSDRNSCGLPLPSVSAQDCADHGVTCQSTTETCKSCTKDIDSWKEANP